MSTRCFIGKKAKNGRVTGIYCNSDGYVSYVGLILYLFYNTPEKLNELINLGELSALGPYIGKKIDIQKRRVDYDYYNKTRYQCVAYSRDGNEEKNIYHFNNIRDSIINFGSTYQYYFINNDWYCYDYYNHGQVLQKLGGLLSENNEIRDINRCNNICKTPYTQLNQTYYNYFKSLNIF